MHLNIGWTVKYKHQIVSDITACYHISTQQIFLTVKKLEGKGNEFKVGLIS